MRKAVLSSALFVTLFANLLAHPQSVRGEERASLLVSEVLTGGTTAVDEYVRIEASDGLPVELRDVE